MYAYMYIYIYTYVFHAVKLDIRHHFGKVLLILHYPEVNHRPKKRRLAFLW